MLDVAAVAELSFLESFMRQYLFRVLAFLGALWVLGSVATFSIRRLTYHGATGVVMGPNERPASGVPVFLDRGGAAVERFVTDSAGHFLLPLEERELRRAVWLICVPGGIPMIGDRDVGQIGPTTYGFTAYPASQPVMVRAFGWRGPIPRECPQHTDSLGWRYPASARMPTGAFTTVEPDWNAHASR